MFTDTKLDYSISREKHITKWGGSMGTTYVWDEQYDISISIENLPKTALKQVQQFLKDMMNYVPQESKECS